VEGVLRQDESEPEVHVRHPTRRREGWEPGKGAPPTEREVVIQHRGLELVLLFSSFPDGDLIEMLVAAGSAGAPLAGRELRQVAPDADLYIAYARAAMNWMNPDVPSRKEDFRRAAEALRPLGGPGRRLPPKFYRNIAQQHDAMVAAGEPHPVKAISEAHHVTISAASRWLSKARQLGFLDSEKSRG
jgi:hypothetical protein